MEKLLFKGTCIATGETLTGSLVQFEDGTHTIMYSEKDDRGWTSPVYPDSVEPVNAKILFED